MMPELKHAKLIALLLNKTRNRELVWKETARGNTFQVSFPKVSVQISEEDESIVQVSIINDKGEVVDSFTNYEFRELIEALKDSEPFAFLPNGEFGVLESRDAVMDVFHLARRVALGADRALDEVLSLLAG
jgi:hypothetical protein